MSNDTIAALQAKKREISQKLDELQSQKEELNQKMDFLSRELEATRESLSNATLALLDRQTIGDQTIEVGGEM